jgi:DNA-binding transcriptional LysR family regulator
MGENRVEPDGAAPIGIQLRHMRYFLAVLDELHFGRAAKRLHISQPPLSQAIRGLEEELGVQLFQRDSHGVTPTSAGLVFGEQARGVLASVDAAVAETRRVGGLKTTLRVGCTPHFPVARMQLFLAALQERIGPTHSEMTHLLSVHQVRRLSSGELDLGIIFIADVEAGIEIEPLFPGGRYQVFFRSDHPLAELDVIGPADLRDEVLCMLPRAIQPKLHDLVLSQLEQAGYSFKDIRQVGGTDPRDLILSVAAEGGVTVGPEWFRPEAHSDAIIVPRPLEPPVLTADIGVAWRADPRASLKTATEAAREVAQTLYRSWVPLVALLPAR